MEAVYEDVNDIDMYIGGLLELPTADDAIVGPTALCLIADQFAKTKSGDRFFYDVGGPAIFLHERYDLLCILLIHIGPSVCSIKIYRAIGPNS